MKITAEYKGRQVTFDVPDEKLDELVKEQEKTGWEKPKKNLIYWFVNDKGEVHNDRWVDDDIDRRRYAIGNYFTSKELAENIARYQSLDSRIRRRIAEICEPVKFGFPRHHIIYSTDSRKIISDRVICHYGGWRCDTEEHAEQIINEFREELMWYFTEFKDRMDG